MSVVTVSNISSKKNNDDFIYGAVIDPEKTQPHLDPYFDKFNFAKIAESADPSEDGMNSQFDIGYEKNQLVARIRIIKDGVPVNIGEVPVTPEHAVELLLRLGEKYRIINNYSELSSPGQLYQNFLANHLKSVAAEMPYFLSWMVEKINNKNAILQQMQNLKDPVALTALLENQDIVYLIGKTNTQEFRSKLPDVVSKKYFNLKQQASVLKEIGGVPNKEKREIERGIFHDHVIGNILSGSISTFGLYNVMKAIETAPPNAYTRETERRDWSILRVIPKEGLIQLATELWNDSKTTKIFVNKLDFALRSLSKHPELMEDLESIPRTIKFIRAYPSKKITTTVLSGLDGLVRDIDKIGTQKWIETKLPYVTQFQGLKIPNLSGNFKDFE